MISNLDQEFIFSELYEPIETLNGASNNYHHRLSLFHIISEFAKADSISSKTFNERFTLIMEKGLDDPVVNCRLLVCQTIADAGHNLVDGALDLEGMKEKLLDVKENDPDP